MNVDYTVFKPSSRFKADNPAYVDSEDSIVKMNHFAAYLDASKYGNALFMEDDFDFDFSAATIIPHAISQLPYDWDYLGLFWNLGKNKKSDAFSNYSPNLIRLRKSVWIGGVAYALSASGIQKVLECGMGNGIAGDTTIANMINNSTLKAFIVTPLVLDHLGSTLEFPSIRINDTTNPYKPRIHNSIFMNLRNTGAL